MKEIPPEAVVLGEHAASLRVKATGKYFVLDGVLVVSAEGEGCIGCFGDNDNRCSALPQCEFGIIFSPVLEHEPTAEKLALMRLKGEW